MTARLKDPCWIRHDQPRQPDLCAGDALRVFVGPSEECGCPEEEWEVMGCPMIVHIEPEGSGHMVFLPNEDNEIDIAFHGVSTIDELRWQALDYANHWLGERPHE